MFKIMCVFMELEGQNTLLFCQIWTRKPTYKVSQKNTAVACCHSRATAIFLLGPSVVENK